MTMKLEEPGRLRVAMEQGELQQFDLTFAQLDYDHPKTRQMLNSLLIKATRTTGFKLMPGRLVIEAFPAPAGGCIIYFTVRTESKNKRVLRKSRRDAYIFEFENAGDMLDGISIAFRSAENKTAKSDLYSYGGGWRLELERVPQNDGIAAVLNEYAARVFKTRLELAATHEYGCCICRGNALYRIGSVLTAYN